MRHVRAIVLVAVAVLLAPGLPAQDGIVSIDHVTNLITPQTLYAGATHIASVRYNLLANQPPGNPGPYWWGSNGFELYSPDGANWNYLEGSWGPLLTAAAQRGVLSLFGKHFFYDGTSWAETADQGATPAGPSTGVNSRAGFYLATFSAFANAGYIGGEDNDIALYLEFQSRLNDDGLALCMDTCAAIVAWEWSNGNEDYPLWDNGLGENGPRCWEIHKCANCCPEWCWGTEGMMAFAYCGQAQYQLCAGDDPICWPITYSLAPPYDNGNYGTVDPESGLWTWSGPTVPQGGTLDIEFRAFDGGDYLPPFVLHVLVTSTGCDCCEGRVGDANHSGEDEPTISDVAIVIDHLFISRPGFDCYREADINQSGGLDPYTDDITISDVSMLIDYLFITGQQGMSLPECPQ